MLLPFLRFGALNEKINHLAFIARLHDCARPND